MRGIHVLQIFISIELLTLSFCEPPAGNSIQYGPQNGNSERMLSPILPLSGPTVACENGMLKPTSSAMGVIGPCMERYANNMKCVENCYAENAMDALNDDGTLCEEAYIEFVPKNFPFQVVDEVTRLWRWCFHEFGSKVDPKDQQCTILDQYSHCIFRAFMLPC